jgi:Rod binding domain-containing protein
MELLQLPGLSEPGEGFEALQIARGGQSRDAVRSCDKDEQLKAAAKQFEAVFVNQILKQMQETIQESSFDPEDSSNHQVHGMYCTFLADAVSERGGFGLWETIYEQLGGMQNAGGSSERLNATV